MTPAVKVAKRAIDLLASAVGLAVTVPLYPLIGAAIWLDSPGPLFYRQKRAGELLGPDGPGRFKFREFEMLKFRTMQPDAERATGAVLAQSDDPRVTRIGRFLRKTRIDELPQFWNVLTGDMSLVGPRPERPELLSNLALAIPFFEERMRNVKPGITGLAQITLGYSGRAPDGSPIAQFKEQLTNPFKLEGADDAEADDMRMKMLFDLAYSANLETFASFLATELRVIAQTPLVMLKGLGR
ncbi:MAG: glycosyltransferase [Myxococcales bacterium]|nr:glycosyltransferase [Myxococcales bacterium]